MSFLNRFRTSHKLGFILALILTAFLSMAALFHYTQIISNDAHEAEDRFTNIRNLVLSIGKNIQEARFWEESFLMTNNVSSVSKHKEIIVLLREMLNKLSLSVTDKKQQSSANDVSAALENYADIFDSVVHLRTLNGLNHNSGLHGELRRAIQRSETIIKEQGELFLMYSMLSIRHHEKNFLARHKKVYVNAFNIEFSRLLNLLDSSDLSDENRQYIYDHIRSYKILFHEIVNGINDIDNKMVSLQESIERLFPALHSLEEQTNKLTADANKAYTLKNVRAEYTFNTVLAVMAFICTLLMALVIRSINCSAKHLQRALSAIASGDAVLTERIPVEGKDEMADIANLFNQFMESLQAMMGEVSNMATYLTDSAISAQSAKDETTVAIKTQVDEIEKIAGEIDSMTTSIENVADNARSASDKANEADLNATTGQQVVTQVINSIQTLASNVEQAGTSVEKLDEYSQDIDSVVAMINSIAEQTNLLALNAAIEAARAGEAGRGFAVVADEVRTLSKRTTSSTQEIKKTIENLQQGTIQAVEVMQLSREQAVESVAQAQQAGESLGSIAKSVADIVTLNAEMSQSASEQSVSARQISQNIHGINTATNKLAESAQQTMSDSGDVSQTAFMLKNISTRFGKSSEGQSNVESTPDSSSDIELF